MVQCQGANTGPPPSCLDVADAVLDARIALGILLGDGEGQAIGYKLRLRAAALANLVNPGRGTSVSVAVKETYEARSRIVRGIGRKSRAKNTNGNADARETASCTLRTVMRAVLDHAGFLPPGRIEEELLVGR